MNSPEPRTKAPSSAKRGEIIEIKTLLMHPMETGLRRDGNSNLIPRKIINRFVCKYNGTSVFSIDLYPAVAANPYMEFHAVARETGTLEFIWHEDGGKIYTSSRNITVS